MRCKPAEEPPSVWECVGKQSLKFEAEEFQPDAVSFGESHEEFYANHISDWVKQTITGGHNLAIIAYGLPNSGKTYCMMGTAGQSRIRPEARGVIVRCFDQLAGLFECGEMTRVTGSFCHVFEDGRIADLLDTKKRNLQVEERGGGGGGRGYGIIGCTEQVLTNSNDVVRLIEKAHLMRNATGSVQQQLQQHTLGRQLTAASTNSSPTIAKYKPHRSHAVFQYNIEHIRGGGEGGEGRGGGGEGECDDPGAVLVSNITIADLAGHSVPTEPDSCSTHDVGLKAMHDTLEKLSQGDVVDASRICKSTPLSRLLHQSMFGNSKCLVVSTLPMDSTVARLPLEISLSFKNAKNLPDPTILSLDSTTIGGILSEMDAAKKLVLEQCTGHSSSKELLSSVEVVDQSTVKIGEKIYDNLEEQTSALLEKYLGLKNSLLIHSKKEETKTVAQR